MEIEENGKIIQLEKQITNLNSNVKRLEDENEVLELSKIGEGKDNLDVYLRTNQNTKKNDSIKMNNETIKSNNEEIKVKYEEIHQIMGYYPLNKIIT